jgi:hypothetical protein
MFAAGSRADENDGHAAADLADFDGDAYLGEVASMLRDSAAEKQETLGFRLTEDDTLR